MTDRARSASQRFRTLLFIAMLVFLVLQGMNLVFRLQAREHGKAIGHLPFKEFEEFSVVLAGTGTEYENPGRLGPTTAIGLGKRVVLVDCGMASTQALRLAEIPVRQIDTIFLTSLLPENTLGLDDLLYTGWLSIEPRAKPLRLVGPPGTQALAAGLVAARQSPSAAKGERLGLPLAGAQFEVIEVEDGWSESSPGISIRAASLPNGPLPGLAYRFEARNKALVVAGIDWHPEAVSKLATGADILVHEAYYWDPRAQSEESGMDRETIDRLSREAELHTAASKVAKVAQAAQVKTLVLTRLRPAPMYSWQFMRLLGPDFRGNIVVAKDGETLTP